MTYRNHSCRGHAARSQQKAAHSPGREGELPPGLPPSPTKLGRRTRTRAQPRRGCPATRSAPAQSHSPAPATDHGLHSPATAAPRPPEPPGCATTSVQHAAPRVRCEKGAACPARPSCSHSMPGSRASRAIISQKGAVLLDILTGRTPMPQTPSVSPTGPFIAGEMLATPSGLGSRNSAGDAQRCHWLRWPGSPRGGGWGGVCEAPLAKSRARPGPRRVGRGTCRRFLHCRVLKPET